MSPSTKGAWGTAALLLAVGLASSAGSGVDGQAGQIAFVPVESIGEIVDTGPTIDIESCEEDEVGLTVVGHVESPDALPVVLTTSARSDMSGARVGRASASDAAPLSSAVEGDFVVTIPWASSMSRFAVSTGSGPGDHGPVGSCP